MKRIRELIARLLRRRPEPELGKVAYDTSKCSRCGDTSAVMDGLCWYCRTGNERVSEPMVWTGD